MKDLYMVMKNEQHIYLSEDMEWVTSFFRGGKWSQNEATLTCHGLKATGEECHTIPVLAECLRLKGEMDETD